MKFSVISDAFARMEATSSRIELTKILVELFSKTPPDLLEIIVYLLQGKLRPEFEGVELGVAEKLAARAVSKSSGIPLAKIEAAYRRDGDLGRAAASILDQKAQTTFLMQEITVMRVYETFLKIARLGGTRSQNMKMKYISSLLNDATPKEASFVLKILLGTLRLGIAENTMMDALAVAFAGSKEKRVEIEHAYNVSSDLGAVARRVAEEGTAGVANFTVRVFNPVRPMLAERVKSEAEALAKMNGDLAAEYKLDGERVQLHIRDEKVMLFSRRLENITSHYPDIVEGAPRAISAGEAILEAEAVAINPDTGEFLAFQELMHRRRKYGIEQAASEYPVSVNFFDVLYIDGKSCLDWEYRRRRQTLEEITKPDDFVRLIPMSALTEQAALEDFMEGAINSGCEGLMLKSWDAPYRAGSRGSNWLKLKREYRNELGDSLDLVVIGAFFGKGRRTGRYGTLLLATYDNETDSFPSICKVGTGFTDEDLDQLYQMLSGRVTLKKNPRINSGMEADVWFEPELVIEIVASEITQSPVHKAAYGAVRKEAGLALRFPKFTGKFRTEKTPEDASTDMEVVALYRGQKRVAQDGTAAV